MSSGDYAASGDLLVYCQPPCYFEGWVPAIEDMERLSLSWKCPECDREWEELKSDDDH